MVFGSWLQNQITERNWDQSELARRATMAGYRISSTQISRIVSGDRKAGPDACISIAHALGIPREEVFRARGWLIKPSNIPQEPILAPAMAEVVREIKSLPQRAQELAAYPLKAQLDTLIEALNDSSLRELTEFISPEEIEELTKLRTENPNDYYQLIAILRETMHDILKHEQAMQMANTLP